MPHLRSRAAAAGPSTAAPSSPPPAAPSGTPAPSPAPSGTPAPSPTSSLGIGLGLASPVDVVGPLKSPTSAPTPRRSLRLVGVGSPATTPTSAPSARDGGSPGPGSGSGRKGRTSALASASASPAASPVAGNSGTDSPGSGANVSAGGGGGSGPGGRARTFMSLRSGSRIAKRQMETGGQAGAETGPGSGGGVDDGSQPHDEMLQQDDGAPAKRYKRVLVGGVETDYVSDSESDSDDCVMLGEVCTKLQLSTGTSVVGMSHGVEMEQSASPVRRPSSPENEIELRRYMPRNEGRVEGKLVLGNNNSGAGVRIQDGTGSQKYSPDSKEKGKMVVQDNLSSSSSSSSEDEMKLHPVFSKEIQSSSASAYASMEPPNRVAARERAIKLAPKFAFFKADKDDQSDDDDEEELEPAADTQDWPGPFSTAAMIYEERAAKLKARESISSKLEKPADKAILWSPAKDRKNLLRSAPSLTNLCLHTLADHAEGIESLVGISDDLKHKLVKLLCRYRKMNTHLLNGLLCDSPSDLQLYDCSWLNEDDFEKAFGKCSIGNLQVLQLDLSGRCLPDYILRTTLAKVPNCMPMLTKISLKGNYRLSDKGLETIVSAAPSLSSLNLCECSLLTASGIEILADKLHSVLRELYIDDCTEVDAMKIIPSLQKIEHLEVLSMSGIQSVCDGFVNELVSVHGSNMKELAFAGCLQLTSSSIKTIGQNCASLTSLDLRNLNRLRNSAMRHLSNGCKKIKKLKLQRNSFSDEAVSKYLVESGGCLTELMLNNVEKVGDLTALAIAHKCSVRIEVLDLSFCRDLTDEALGLIVDSCSSLRVLKLFGCTQVSDVFLKGHSNGLVTIIGLEGSILEQIHDQ